MSSKNILVNNGLCSVLDKIADFVLKENIIVNGIYRDPQYNDEPKIFNYGIKYKSKRKDNLNIASGFSFDKKLALVKVLGEALERYSLDIYKPKIVAKGSITEISKLGQYLKPLRISPFSVRQLKQRENSKFVIRNSSKFSWSEAVFLNKNKKILIPSQLISFNHSLIDGEPEIMPINSTGTAFGLTFDEALYRALCEAIERDAFVISYLNKLPSPRIDLKSLNDTKIDKILDILGRYKLEVFVLDLTMDIGIPVFGALVIDKTGLGPAISLGLKAGWETKNCIIGAIEESLMTRSWIRDKSFYINPKSKKVIKIENIEQRALLWFPTQMIEHLNFWLKNKNIIRIDTKKKSDNKLEKTLKSLIDNGMNIIYKDITPKVIKNAGFFVIRTLIPELQPLYLNEKYKFLGSKRLYDVPPKLGFTKKNEAGLNKVPHPFL